MQPKRLKLVNFLPYAEEEVNFDDIHVAALCGENGAGKSSIIDAMNFALYGKGRADTLDDWVRQGAEEGSVEFRFCVKGNEYRIIRQRSVKGRGKSALELAQMNGDGWESLTAEKISDTEDKIRNLLRMDYDTFVSSCFILQGKSDQFCAAGPADRKRILAQILGLDIYGELLSGTKDLLSDMIANKELLERRIDEITEEIADMEPVKDALTSTQDDILGAKEVLEKQQEQLESLQSELQEKKMRQKNITNLESELQRLTEEKRQITEWIKELKDLSEQAGKHKDLHEELQQLKQSTQSLEQQLEGQEKELQQLKIKASRRQELTSNIQQLQDSIESYEKRLNQLKKKKQRYLKISERADEIREKAEEYDSAKKQLSVLEQKAGTERELMEQQSTLKEKSDKWESQRQTAIAKLDAQLDSANKQSERLEEVPCSEQGDLQDSCPLLSSAVKARDQLDSIVGQIEDLSQRINPHKAKLANVQEKIRELGYSHEQHQRLRERVAKLEKWSRLLPELEQAEERIAEIDADYKESSEALQKEQKRWSEQQNELEEATIAYKKSKDKAKQMATTKNHINHNREQIAALQEELGQAKAALERYRELSKQTEDKKERLDIVEQKTKELQREIESVEDIEEQINDLESKIKHQKDQISHQKEELNKLQVAAGKLEQQVTSLEKKADSKSELESDLKDTQRKIYLHEQLVKAFGKNGIPALIVENAIPDIESMANDILGRFTNGRMSVELVTQKATKTSGLSETLDIVVADELGERPYQMFSGAERFEIDLSIRLAISKFLANRAGTKIETLVIDEGASCLDQQGRMKFVEAINTISEEFSKIIVISHIDELKEAFPQRIEVWKTPGGSKIEVL